MITTLERAIMNEEEYDMREYLADARQIAGELFKFNRDWILCYCGLLVT